MLLIPIAFSTNSMKSLANPWHIPIRLHLALSRFASALHLAGELGTCPTTDIEGDLAGGAGGTWVCWCL